MRFVMALVCSTMLLSCTVFQKATSEKQVENEVPNIPVLVFDTPEVDFGEVTKGETRSYSFTFTNKGGADLLIELTTACTCTSIDWPRVPVPPGGKGSVDVVFDSSTKDGPTSVDVDVIANTEPIVVTAVIKANVVPSK